LDGKTIWVDVEEFDTTNGIADFGTEDYFNEIGQSYLAEGHGNSGMVGTAQSHLIDATQMTAYALKWMNQHYRPTT
jgi:aminoglycoside 3-N-acetyltransferase